MFGTSQTGGTTLGRSASFSFSQPPANKPFSGGFGFGSENTLTNATQPAAAPAATGGLSFGTNQPTTTTITTNPVGGGGGLFGSTLNNQPTTTATTTTTGGLFGSSTTQQQPSGSLFGSFTNNATQQQPQLLQQQQQPQQQASTGGSLFGNPTQPAASSTTTGGTGLFGSSNTTGTGLFGASVASKPATTGFNLGNSATTGASGGLFGSSTNAGSTGLFGSSKIGAGSGPSLFGQSQNSLAVQQQQQQQQQQQSQLLQFGYYQKERFNDLPENASKLIEELDRHIQSQMQARDELKTKDFGVEIRKCAAEWQELDSVLKSLSATLDSDLNQARDVAERVERDRADNVTLYAIASNAREGRSDGSAFVEWLQKYFVQLADEFRHRIHRYRSTIEAIERHLQSVDQSDQYTPQSISDAIHAQHTSFMTLAAQVASLHAEVETLKKDYAKWYKQTHKSFRDPFATINQLADQVPHP